MESKEKNTKEKILEETLFWKYGNYGNDYYDNCSSWIYWMLLIGMRIGKVGGLRWENIEMCHCHF